MDFSGQQYFAGGQPYQFMGIPPLTPSHSHSAPSEDFNTTSPPEVFEAFPNEHFHQNFEFQPQFNQQPHNFPGPPTPPNHPIIPGQQQQPQQQPQPHQALNGHHKPQLAAEILPQPKAEPVAEDQGQGRGHSNSDEDDLTPAQSRRKAQNRAAQRAFRERKERHVKELEQALASLKESQLGTAAENERLKRELQKISTENEILRATSSMQGPNGSLSPEPTMTGPMQYNPTDFYSNVLQNHTNKTPSHRIVTSDDGERLLAAGATWDFIISHELFKRGLVDVGDVSERLKHLARCDGQGPVFSEREILAAIESSVASGSDELL